jgi:ATP-dependent exoDNAse (exonuclease V) beta subunit
MSPDLRPFEANSFPLDCGIRLLEASAGTGKTFALAHLVLRLVTEEGLSLRRLLVVTYTEAAAAELRDRIGRRLQEALASLAEPATDPDAASVDPGQLLECRLSISCNDTATATAVTPAIYKVSLLADTRG